MNPILLTCLGLFLPFFGNALGAGTVFFMPKGFDAKLKKCLFGFAAGVMLASLVWSLILPSLSLSASPLPTIVGFLLGMGTFIFSGYQEKKQRQKKALGKRNLFLAVTLHNIPEGMAVGVAFAGAIGGSLTYGSAFLLAVGIAMQNFPEGAIISTPLAAGGMKKKKAAKFGILSGTVEPIGGALALILTGFITWILPYVLSFAAGAMLFVATDELIPALEGEKKEWGLWSIAIGFALMMTMDILLG